MDSLEFENAIVALEQALAVSVTIIDNQGVFKSAAGRGLFNLRRMSHRKNPACDAGFCDKCIDHCRHQMNAKCEALPEVFVETCWKGVTEIVVPLQLNGEHLGMFYVGAWRGDESALAKMSENMKRKWRELERFDPANAERLIPLLKLFVKGMLAELAASRKVGRATRSRAGRIRRFFTERSSEPLQLEDLCVLLNLSRSRTSALLQELFGKTFNTLLNEERVNRAKMLLLSSDDTVSDVATAVGMEDAYYFSRVFKKLTGFPPGRYRQISRSNA